MRQRCRSGSTCACPATTSPAATTSLRQVRAEQGAMGSQTLGQTGSSRGSSAGSGLGRQARAAFPSPTHAQPFTTHASSWFCCVVADPDRPYCQVYTVQLGDTTTSVAAKFGISEAELIALNSGEKHWRAGLPVGKQQRSRNSSRCSDILFASWGLHCRSSFPAAVPPAAPTSQPASQPASSHPYHPCMPCSPADYLDAGFTLPRAGQYVRLPGW